jgi:hypothetical protein
LSSFVVGIVFEVIVILTIVPRHFGRDISIRIMPVCLGDGIRCHILVVAIAILVAVNAATKERFIIIGIVVEVVVIATIVPRHFGHDIDIRIMPLHLNGDRIQYHLVVAIAILVAVAASAEEGRIVVFIVIEVVVVIIATIVPPLWSPPPPAMMS